MTHSESLPVNKMSSTTSSNIASVGSKIDTPMTTAAPAVNATAQFASRLIMESSIERACVVVRGHEDARVSHAANSDARSAFLTTGAPGSFNSRFNGERLTRLGAVISMPIGVPSSARSTTRPDSSRRLRARR